MVHTFEVFVDIREMLASADLHNGTARYEISAESVRQADSLARNQVRQDYPHGAEFDIRVTKVLK